MRYIFILDAVFNFCTGLMTAAIWFLVLTPSHIDILSIAFASFVTLLILAANASGVLQTGGLYDLRKKLHKLEGARDALKDLSDSLEESPVRAKAAK